MAQRTLTGNKVESFSRNGAKPGLNGHEHSARSVPLVERNTGPLQLVSVGNASLDSYRKAAGGKALEEVRRLASPLEGARVLHLNSTAYGGGVAEILRSHIPLMRDIGIHADWMTIAGDDPFFRVTKAFHNALQGAEYNLTVPSKKAYLDTNSRNTAFSYDDYDYIIVHDPQPAAIRSMYGSGKAKWVWRCHIDLSDPNPQVWRFLRPYVDAYDAVVFTMAEYAMKDLPPEKVWLIPPAIDPTTPKNTYLPPKLCENILSFAGIDTRRPLVTQVSRFDPWKDPLGVVEAYRKVKRQVPEVQLAMLGHLAMDDPQGAEMYEATRKAAGSDPDVHMYTNFTAASSIEVNAFQRSSDVVIQKSIREGFGLVVAEAQWKSTAVVAGRVGGIPMQLRDGKGGYLVDSIDECADRVLHLLEDPEQAKAMGERGHRYIRSHYLTPRLVADELKLLSSL